MIYNFENLLINKANEEKVRHLISLLENDIKKEGDDEKALLKLAELGEYRLVSFFKN